ncbi:MAG: hypothetical protein ACETWM_06340 [Candidatus Lokiarchaeia archaeon]
MYEKDVKEVFTNFLEKQGKKFKTPKGAAPDLLIDNIAVEIEGSWVNFKATLEKYVRYALEYSSLEIVFPTDSLDVNKVYLLLLLEKLLEKKSRPPIKIHLVIEVENGNFALKTFSTVQELYDKTVSRILDILESAKDLPKDEENEKIFLTLIFADEEIKNMLIEETKSSENKISMKK